MPLKLITKTNEAQEDVIYRLEQALEMAKAGTMVGVGIAYVTNKGTIGTGFSRCENGGMLIGACSLLSHRVCVDD
jgi:hypothetical protein